VAKTLYIRDLKPSDTVRTSFLVKSKALMNAKNGKPFLSLLLSDSSGDLEGRVWEGAEEKSLLFDEGQVVAVSGKTGQFQNRMQLSIDSLAALPPEEIDLVDYLPEGPANIEGLYEELLATFRNVTNPHVRALALSLLEDPEIAARYKVCPAAKTIHHAFLGGLLSHSLQLIKIVDAIVPFYPGVNRDLLVFGAAFHDFGKIYELTYQGSFGYSDEGKLVGHITIGAILIDRKIQTMPGFPKDIEMQVKHLVLSHHGRLEYGSPKRPATLEAQILQHLDDMDSKIQSIQTLLAQDSSNSRWSGYHKAYDQYYYRTDPNHSEVLPKL